MSKENRSHMHTYFYFYGFFKQLLGRKIISLSFWRKLDPWQLGECQLEIIKDKSGNLDRKIIIIYY